MCNLNFIKKIGLSGNLERNACLGSITRISYFDLLYEHSFWRNDFEENGSHFSEKEYICLLIVLYIPVDSYQGKFSGHFDNVVDCLIVTPALVSGCEKNDKKLCGMIFINFQMLAQKI